MPNRPPLTVLLIYATGQLGWSLAAYATGNLLVYFYLPPETGSTPLFPPFIFQGAVLGVFTLIGLLSAGGRLLDAFVDPLVANWSDGHQSRLGKRRWFLLVSAAPLALLSWLVFVPLRAEPGWANGLWLALCLGGFYFFLAVYVIPYTALLAELGHDPADRMKISTLLSVTFALGYLIGTQLIPLQNLLVERGQSPTEAFQTALGAFSIFALVCLLVPAFFLPERRYARQATQAHSLSESLRTVFANRNFRYFLASNLLYWLALTFIQLGIFYYVTVLLGQAASAASAFLAIGFVTSFLLYVPLNRVALRWGKKRLMLAAFAVLAGLFVVVFGLKLIPVSPSLLLPVLAVVAAFPLAAFGILPNAIVGDVVDAEERQSGRQLAGMFYGVGAFVMKLGVSLANLLFPSLLLLGKSSDSPVGVQATAVAAALFCLGGWWAFSRFQE